MSLLTGIENLEHSTVAWFAKEYQSIHGELPAIDALVDRVAPYMKVLLQTVVTAEFGAPAGTLVADAVSSAQADLDVVSATVYDVGATPSAASMVSAVQSNLSGLLTAGHVTNPTSVATVTKVVTELGSLSTAITNATPAPATPAA
jgi:hypothetical protein